MAVADLKFAAKKCSCKLSRSINDPNVKAILPVGYKYSLCQIKYLDNAFFESRIRIDISTKERALKWLDEFMLSSNTIFKKSATFPEDTQSNIYRVKLRCHHNTRPISKLTGKKSKNTNCPSKLSLTVKRSSLSRKYESKDIHLKEFPTVVSLYHVHNHSIDADDAMQYRQPNSDVTNKFLNMFECGYTPAKAISKHTNDLKALYGDDKSIEKDRTMCPKKRWVYSLYTSFKKKHGLPSKDVMLTSLESFIEKYNEEHKGKYGELKVFEDGSFAIVIVTPIMKRVLVNIPEASEILFVDSIGSIERNNCKIMLLLTNSWCGELPVGCIITSSEREEVLDSAIELFQSFLNENSFGGRGRSGPRIIMTGLRKSERNSFLKVFPESVVLLCVFQMFQNSWRYIMNSHSGFPPDKQPQLFLNIKDLIYSQSKVELKSRYEQILECPVSNQYERYIEYVKKLYTRREEWASCFRKKLKLKEENCSVICEAAIKFIKEGVLNQVRIQSIVPLFDFIVSDVENFYENKLISLSNGQKPTYLRSNFDSDTLSIVSANQIGPKCFQVLNENSGNVYFLDLDVCLCSCNVGQFGAMCSHQFYASTKYSIDTITPQVPTDPLIRKILFFVATSKDLPSSWFGSLNEDNVSDMEFDDNENEIYREIEKEMNKNAETDDNKSVGKVIKVEKADDENRDLKENATFSLVENECENGNVVINNMETLERLQTVFNRILSDVNGNPLLLHASQAFLSNFENIQSDNDLALALCSFGKFNDVSR